MTILLFIAILLNFKLMVVDWYHNTKAVEITATNIEEFIGKD